LWVTLAIVIVAVNGSRLTRTHRQQRTEPSGRVDDTGLLGHDQGKP
jgi:hypothetical protein